MEAYTQSLLQRTRQRREVLQKKLENSPAQRKRKPLEEDHSENIEVLDNQNDESPKRQCVREDEIDVKPDTPAIQGVRSRLQNLAARQKNWSGSDDRTECEVGPTKAPEPELNDVAPLTPRSRRGRLAALAQNINEWEDDSAQTPPVRKEEKSATKVWNPNKGTAPLPPDSPNVYSPSKGRAPLPPTAITASRSPFKSPEKSKLITPVEEVQPSKPPRTFEYENEEKFEVKDKDCGTVVSKLTVTLGSSTTESNKLSVVQGKSTSPMRRPSPVKSAVNSIQSRPGNIEVNQKNIRTSPVKSFTETVHYIPKTGPSQDLNESIAEPTKQPVTARMTAWQNKIQVTEKSEPKGQRSPTKITTAKAAVWQPKYSPTKKETVKPTTVKAGNKPVPIRADHQAVTEPVKLPQPKLERVDKAKKDKRKSFEPTSQSVHMRMAAWETRTTQEIAAIQGQLSPTKLGIKGASLSSIKSASNVATSAKSLQQKLAGLQQNWDKKDEKLQEVKQQRQEELNKLSNRWKDGILKETDDTKHDEQVENEHVDHSEHVDSEHVQQEYSVPPPAPPAPPLPAASIERKTPAPRYSPVKSTPTVNATIKSRQSKVGDARQRAKTENEEIEENMDISDSESNAEQNDPNFENKLKAMGFEMESTVDLGHVASVDLKGHPRPERAVPKSTETRPISTPVSSKWEVKKDITVSWGQEKTVAEKNVSTIKTDMTKTIKELKPSVDLKGSTPARIGGTSIYSLIKKQQTPSVPAAPPTPSTLASRATPAPVHSALKAVRYTASTDDSFGDSIIESDIDDATFVTTLHEDASSEGTSSGSRRPRNSLSSTNSESNYSETHTEDYTEAETGTEYTDGDTTGADADYSEDYTEDYTEDDGYSDEDSYTDDDEDEQEGVDTLLDEALDDDSLDETPQAIPVRNNSRTSLKKPSPDKQVCFKQPVAAPRRHQSGNNYASYHQPGSSTSSYNSQTGSSTGTSTGTSSGSDTDDKPVVYSVEFYRAQKNKKQGPPPKMTVVRHSQNMERQEPEEEPLPYIPEKEVKDKIRELQELVNQEQSVIMQTSNALNQCCGSNSSFAGSMEQIECNRLLLVACKRREAYITEIDRLRSPEGSRQHHGALGSLTISDIRLPLKSDFVSKLGTSHDTTVHYFICLIRNGPQIIFTQMVSTHDPNIRGSLEFPNLIKVGDIRQDFRLTCEIYGMSITREPSGTPKSKKNKMTLTPRKLMKMKSHTPLQSPGGPMAVRSTNFVLIGDMPLSMNDVNKMHFSLSKVPFLCPLQGSIHLRLRCLIETQVQEHGFLTMFEDVSGFGAWHRRWCALKNNMLCFWKYPDDEKIKEPMGKIDLKSCVSENIGLIARDICARPNTFELVSVRRQNKGESDTLITRCYNTMTTVRHMLSADTKDDRIIWCQSLNQALTNVRSWHADALRPIKQSKPSN